jgi:HEAT repeat protein
LVFGFVLGGILAGATTFAQDRPPIREFVHRTFAHGVPYAQAVKYQGRVAQEQLIAMLDSNDERAAWANIVTVLGIVGDSGAVGPMLQFVRRGTDRLDRTEYGAKTAAVFALGYLFNRTHDGRVLEFLTTGLRPETWTVQWRSPLTEDAGRRNVQLTLAAIRALGVSGDPQAEDALRQLQAERLKTFDPPTRDAVAATIGDALAANRQIQARGLPNYLSRPR